MPAKCEDPGMFTIPIVIGEKKFDRALLDLGASINLMPSSIYNSLALGPLIPTSNVILLADGSSVHPRGVVEDVLVKVDKLFFPADFFVLDVSENPTAPIILGRPFMSTSRTKIDVFEGMMTMEFDGDIIEHNIHDVDSLNFLSVYCINDVIPPVKEHSEVELVDIGVEPPDMIHSPPTVLGTCPTFLTPQGRIPVNADKQVKNKELTRPPAKLKCGGGKKKKVKQVWRVTEVNGLRFKPFHKWFIELILKAEVPKGPVAYG